MIEEPEKKPKKKKGIIQKIKDKIAGKKAEPKVIEITSEGNNVIDIATKVINEEVISDGNNDSNR